MTRGVFLDYEAESPFEVWWGRLLA